jgi:GH25 family lysozyme M1 (1,4-beta-N-acetylmuramidase)
MAASAAAPPGNVVRITVRANLRQGAPSIAAPIAGKLDPGTALQVAAVVPGDPVQGDATWYRIGAGDYVWSGACGPFEGPVPGPPVSPGAPSVPPVVDIYDGDRVASFAVARNAGVLGIIHKATTGATGTDDAYAGRRQQALEAGLLWGAYHWGTAAPVAQQVDNFLNLARPDAQTLVALDFESDVGDQMTLQGARDFLTQIESRLGRRAVLYSGATIRAALGETRDPFFGGHRLWLPQYALAPVVPPSWDTYWLWQYTDGTAGPGPRQAPGIPGNARGQLDCNRFDGSADQLAAQWAS